MHGVGSQDLIGSIYGIHEAVVIAEYLRLVNSSLWVPHTSNSCLTGGLYLATIGGIFLCYLDVSIGVRVLDYVIH